MHYNFYVQQSPKPKFPSTNTGFLTLLMKCTIRIYKCSFWEKMQKSSYTHNSWFSNVIRTDMNNHVSIQMSFLSKSFATYVTNEWPFTSMYSSVSFQQHSSRKCFRAKLTFVFFRTWRCQPTWVWNVIKNVIRLR